MGLYRSLTDLCCDDLAVFFASRRDVVAAVWRLLSSKEHVFSEIEPNPFKPAGNAIDARRFIDNSGVRAFMNNGEILPGKVPEGSAVLD
jgi:hypothetical protein